MTIKSKLIRISSTDRLPGGTPENFIVNFQNVNNMSRVLSVILKHASFPNSVYNITTKNNIFTYEENGVAQTLVTPTGFYSISQLLAYLATNISSITFSQDPTTYKILITNTASAPSFIIYPTGVGLLLGVTSFLNITIGATLPAQSLPELEGLRHLYVQSKTLAKNNNMVFNQQQQEVPIFGMIPVTAAFGNINHYETPHEGLEIVDYDGETNIQNIDITLLNGNGEIINLNGGFFHMILKIYYKI